MKATNDCPTCAGQHDIALKALPVGAGYAVWTGIDAVGTAAMGIFVPGESTEPMRLASIGLIVAGIVGLKLTSPV